MHDRLFALKPKMDGGCVRRVVVQELVQLPARSETNVTGYTMYRDFSSAWETWASKPGSPMGEVRVVRAPAVNRSRDVPIQVMNLASYPVTLTAGVVLAELSIRLTVSNRRLRLTRKRYLLHHRNARRFRIRQQTSR